MKSLDRTENINCKVCPSTFNQFGHLKKHIESQHIELKHQCLKCSKFFNYKHHLKEHVERFHERKIYECEQCGHKLHSSSGIKHHISAVHKKVFYECSFEACDYKASQKSQISLHIRSYHHGEKKFKCNNCDFRAFKKCTLQKHVDSHGSFHPCDICKKEYTTG